MTARDDHAPGQLRLLLAELAIPLLLIAALNAWFASYVARTPSVPVPQLFALPVTSGKFLAFRDATRERPGLDVLLLGMSQMMRIDGVQLEAELEAGLQRPVHTFNFSGPFHSFGLDRRLLRDLVLPMATPTVVLYSVTPQALLNDAVNEAQVDAYVETFIPFGLYHGSPAARLRAFLQLHVPLLGYREKIREALTPPLGWKLRPFEQQARLVNAQGDIPLLRNHVPVKGLNKAEQLNKLRLADFDASLQRTFMFDHFEKFARFCHEHDIALVLLSQPVHPLFLDILPGGRRDYDRYLAVLRQTAARAQVPLFEPIADGIGPPEVYQDTVHLDSVGGAWLTQEVARYLLDSGLLTRPPAR